MGQSDFEAAIVDVESGLGFVIASGSNDDIDFTEGSTGAAVATITATTYKTPALMAAAMQVALNAAATDNTYTVTYSSSTGLVTITRATGSDTIVLNWNTGANKATSIAATAGYSDAADDSGATTYPADNAIDPSDPAQDANLITLYADFLAALNARIAEQDASSPGALKTRAIRQRVLERQREVDAQGAGLTVRP